MACTFEILSGFFSVILVLVVFNGHVVQSCTVDFQMVPDVHLEIKRQRDKEMSRNQ